MLNSHTPSLRDSEQIEKLRFTLSYDSALCHLLLADSKINRQRLRFFTSSAHISSVWLILHLQLKNRRKLVWEPRLTLSFPPVGISQDSLTLALSFVCSIILRRLSIVTSKTRRFALYSGSRFLRTVCPRLFLWARRVTHQLRSG